MREGFQVIAGVDEAGRGSWAGPLVAAAVILGPLGQRRPGWCDGIRDSKLLTPIERERLAAVIRVRAAGIGVGVVAPEWVDLLGLTAAGHLAMWRALRALPVVPEYVLVDAFTIPRLTMMQRAIIHGDRLCLSIAAASIVAKVTRDRIMCELAESYPEYGFEAHKGYGTPHHRERIEAVGISRVHRHSYEPLAPFVQP